MIVARIQFKKEHASRYIDSPDGNQCVTEQVFSSPEELIETLRSIEPYIDECSTVINGRMLSLTSFKAA